MGDVSSRARILSISFSNIAEDARVLRQLDVLKDFGEVTTVGYGSTPKGASEHLEIPGDLPSLPQTASGVLLLALHAHRSVELRSPAVKRALKMLNGRSFDLVVANEARALPLAHAIADGQDVWGDMHEWAPEERTHVLSWRLLVAPLMRFICRRYLPRTAAVTTVNSSIATLYEERFGCHAEVVRNAIPLQALEPSDTDPERIRLVHSGGAVPGRNLEGLVAAVLLLDERFTLDFYLIAARDGGRYLARLRSLAGDSDRIRFHPAVTPDALPATLNRYDLGVYAIPPRTTNHRLMLPNKFFDFVQARLGLVFGPTVETTALIERYGLGIVAGGFTAEDMAAALRPLTAEAVAAFKRSAHVAAPALSSEEDVAVQRSIVARLLADRERRQGS